MIQKLKTKFVVINMSLVALVLLIVCAALLLSFYRQTLDMAAGTLANGLNHPIDTPMNNKPEVGKGRENGEKTRQNGLPSFCVQLDTENRVTAKDVDNVTISDEVLADAVERVLAAGKGEGALPEYDLRYAVRYSTVGAKIAFVDISSGLSNLRRQALLLLICGLCGLTAFFFISLFLSDWALRPAARAWEKQKQFVADASRELQTPLSVILTNADILLAHPEETVGEERHWVENTKAEGERMKGLIADMQYLAKVDVSAPPPMEPLDLSETVRNAVLPYETVAEERGVTLENDIMAGIRLYGSAPEIQKLVGILLENGIRCAGVGGTVRATLRKEGDTVTFLVNHTGVPIDAADLPHVFERFYRTEASRGGKTGGYGLGLAIAQSIVRQHRGELNVSSDGEQGATFTAEWTGGHDGAV